MEDLKISGDELKIAQIYLVETKEKLNNDKDSSLI